MKRKHIALAVLVLLAVGTVIGVYAGTVGVNNLFGFDNITADVEYYRNGVNYTQFIASRYGSDQSLNTTDGVTFATVDTGQGANELYDMDQNVLITSDVNFTSVEAEEFFLSSVNKTDIFAYPESTASYIVFTDGTNYYAKNGTTGQIDYSGVNASNVIQSTIGVGENYIELREGNYTIDNEIDVQNGTRIVGSGYNTVLWLTNNAATNIFKIEGKINFEISYLRLEGNSANNVYVDDTTLNGVYLTQNDILDTSSETIIKLNNLYVYDFSANGIVINGSFLFDIRDCSVFNCDKIGLYLARSDVGGHVKYNTITSSTFNKNNVGVWLGGGGATRTVSYNLFTDCMMLENTDQGIVTRSGANYNVFSNCDITHSSGDGVDIEGDYNQIISCNILANRKHGLRLRGGAQGTIVQNCQFVDNGVDTADFYSDIILYTSSSYNKIISNSILSVAATIKYNIEEFVGGAQVGNVILGNNIGTGGVYIESVTGYTIKYNEDYVTENQGLNESSNDDWIFHGLDPTIKVSPTNCTIVLTVHESDSSYTAQVKDINGTKFQLYLYDVIGAGVEVVDKTISWVAIAYP